MDYFKAVSAMIAKAPVMAVIPACPRERVVVGRIVNVGSSLDRDGKKIDQIGIMERGANSITTVLAEKVEPLWEGASTGG